MFDDPSVDCSETEEGMKMQENNKTKKNVNLCMDMNLSLVQFDSWVGSHA